MRQSLSRRAQTGSDPLGSDEYGAQHLTSNENGHPKMRSNDCTEVCRCRIQAFFERNLGGRHTRGHGREWHVLVPFVEVNRHGQEWGIIRVLSHVEYRTYRVLGLKKLLALWRFLLEKIDFGGFVAKYTEVFAQLPQEGACPIRTKLEIPNMFLVKMKKSWRARSRKAW